MLRSSTEWPLGPSTILYWHRDFVFHTDFKYLWESVLLIYSVLEKNRQSQWKGPSVAFAAFIKNKSCSGYDSWTEWRSSLFLQWRTCQPPGSLTGKGFYSIRKDFCQLQIMVILYLYAMRPWSVKLNLNDQVPAFLWNLCWLLIDSYPPQQDLLADKQ